MNPIDIVEHWVAQIERVAESRFVPIADFAALASGARTESLRWCRTVLTPAFDPHGSARASHSIHVAGQVNLDLLRHDYTLGSQPVSVFEGINFLIVRLAPRPQQPWHPGVGEAAVRRVLNPPSAAAPWTLLPPVQQGDGVFVSSNPGVDPAFMPAWTGRIDLLFRQGLLYVVAYKRYPPNVGFLHDAQWFEDDVRRTWQRS